MTDGSGSAKDADGASKPKLVVIVLTALLVAVATAIGTGLGKRAIDLFDQGSTAPSLTHSEGEQISECGTLLFVGEPRATQLVSGDAPTPRQWEAFRRVNHAKVTSPGVVEVSIQGESERVITLTHIDFDVTRRARPAGATFANPCGGPGTGRFVEVDLDRDPVVVTASGDDPKADFPVRFAQGRQVKPIRFPWTVSLQDPLLLYIVASTKRCDCTWRAGIHWRSGAKSGVLAIDNHGKGYDVVGPSGATQFVQGSSGPAGWGRLEAAGA
jgi:hypothetical protein